MEWLQKIIEADRDLFLYLNSFYSNTGDWFMFMISRKEIWFLFYAAIVAFIIKTYKNKAIIILIFVVILILLSDQFSVWIKETVQRYRPTHDPTLQNLVHSIQGKGGLYGFVSSHAANVFAILTYTALIFRNRWYSYTLLAWAFLVSYSRIYLGVHFPLDIAGGMVVGWFSGWLVYKILMFVENHFFIARSPKIGKTHIKTTDAGVIAGVFFITVILLYIIVRALIHSQLL